MAGESKAPAPRRLTVGQALSPAKFRCLWQGRVGNPPQDGILPHFQFGKIVLKERMDGGTDSGEITGWLEQWAHGDPDALDRLAPLVYDQLRVIADNLLRREAVDHTLQPTALVSETFLKLLELHKVSLNDRSHFFAFAARLMRRVLIDHARREKAAKRFSTGRLPLDPELGWAGSVNEESLDLNSALDELETLDAKGVRALELRYFLGCTGEETAALLGLSGSTVDRSLRFSLAWLHSRLHPD